MKAWIKLLVLVIFVSLLVGNSVWGQKPLTIEEAIQIALKNNSTLKSAYETYRASKSSAFGAWNNFLPKANMNASWDQSLDLVAYFNGVAYPRRKYTYAFNFSLTQTIFDFGRNWSDLGQKRARQRSSENSYKQTKQETIVAVKNASFGLLKTQKLLEVQEDVVKRAQQQLDIAKARYDLGSASLSDYLKAKVQMSNANLDLVNAKNNVEIARATLNTVLGINVDAPTTIDAKLEYQKFEVNLDNSLKTALQNHPLIEKAKADLDAAEAQVSITRSLYLPSFSLNYGYSWQASKFPKDWPAIDDRSIGLQVTLFDFSFFSATSDINNARHNKKAADERLAQQRKDLELQIRTAYLNAQSAEEKILVTQEAAKSAEEDLNITQEKYNLGAASTLELLDAQVSYRTAKTNEVNALFDYTVAVSELEKALGKYAD